MEIEILTIAAGWIAAGHKVAVATVLTTWGSAPRRPGAQMAVRDDGVMAGSVSAGCVENAVVAEALDCLAGGDARQCDFGVSDEQAWSVGLSCGGAIAVWVEPGAFVPALVERLTDARPFARMVELRSGASRLVDGQVGGEGPSHIVDTADGPVFVDPFQTPLRLMVVGATHVAQALARMVPPLGWHMTVIDPRTAFAAPERFPGMALRTDWPDEALADLRPDAGTAIVVLTHDGKIDDPALIAALRSPAFYVGALGSRKTQAARRSRLLAAGLAPNQLDRLHGPVGLPIGAANPAEIAVSILAEIIQAQRARPAFAAIILAAGQSRRMGGGVSKLLRPFDGKPLVRHIAEAASAAGLAPVLMVAGGQGDEVAALVADLPVTILVNEQPERGMGYSLAMGAARLPVNTRGALVCLGDMPRVTAAHLRALIEAFDARDPFCICVPVAAGRRGHPVLFGAGHFAALAALSGDAGARAVLADFASHVREVPLDDAVLFDVDTPADLAV